MQLPEAVTNVLTRIREFFARMEKKTRTRLIIFAVLLIVLIVAIVLVTSHVTYVTLFAGVSANESAEILANLSQLGIEGKIESGMIKVPEGDAETARIQLVGMGYPKTGYTYDTFALGSGLSATDTEKQFYLKSQLENNAMVTLNSMNKVSSSLVMINLPKQNVFASASSQRATASVTLTLQSGETLTQDEVGVVANLISKGVGNGMRPEDVSITDSNMTPYVYGEPGVYGTADQLRMQQEVEALMVEKAEEMLDRIFGPNNYEVKANVVLGFDDVEYSSTEYTPSYDEEGMTRAIREMWEVITDGGEGGVAGFPSNGADPNTYPNLEEFTGQYLQYTREINKEINEKITNVKEAKGQVKSITFSVLYSDEYDDYSEEIKGLVSGATGTLPESVFTMQVPLQDIDNSAETIAQERADSIRSQQNLIAIIKLVLTIVGILAGLFLLLSIVRTVMNNLDFGKKNPAAAAVAGYEGIDVLLDDDGEVIGPRRANIEVDFDDNKSDELNQVEQYIDRSPEAVAQLLRNWLLDN
ncbi:flagellar M-ring protein FliF [Eubacteriales bacterium OttesenSCG-928-N14]|nr:flagellar M-ring protein FliF [Eubacteriales bacterium OttesenSCG-928-N14]